MTDLDAQVRALRTSVGLNRREHVAVVRVDGPDAFALLDLTSPAPLLLREGQMRHTLLLNTEACPLADLYVCSDEDGYVVLADGLSEAALVAQLEGRRAARLPAAQVAIHPQSETHELIGLDGPYAWELVSAWLGPSVLGMPYLTLLRVDDVLAFRAGKTGEFGYDFLVPRGRGALERLTALGAAFDLMPVDLPALDVCALENGHFSIRTVRDSALARPLTPLELQLQWRVAYQRDFVGAEALRARRAAGAAVRATWFTSAVTLAPGQDLTLDGDTCGQVLACTTSPTLGGAVGIALLSTRLAHPGLALVAPTDAGPVTLATRTAPLIRNRSLFVDPHRHSYRTRETETYPSLVLA